MPNWGLLLEPGRLGLASKEGLYGAHMKCFHVVGLHVTVWLLGIFV